MIKGQKTDPTRREEVRRTALEALRQRDFELALSEASAFNAECGFPVDPFFSVSPETLREQIKRTFATNPKILSGVDQRILEHSRIAAGMGFLGLGLVWPSGDPEIEAQMEDMTLDVVAMIISSVQSGMNLDEWRRTGLVQSIKIVGPSDGDSCPACKVAQKRVWPIRDIPELPLADCTSDCGCNCAYVLHEIRE